MLHHGFNPNDPDVSIDFAYLLASPTSREETAEEVESKLQLLERQIPGLTVERVVDG